MRTTLQAVLAVILLGGVANASDLTIVVRNHPGLIHPAGKEQAAAAVFTDERLIADVQLDVFAIPQMPSSSAHLTELRQLDVATWLGAVEWRLENANHERIAVTPAVLSNVRRDRGPAAVRQADRDASVDCVSYHATLAFPALPPGDYTLSGEVRGVSSHFAFSVRTGEEKEWHDLYLRDKAASARSYDDYKAFQLARLDADPERLDVVMELFDRSLQEGTLTESRSYIDRAKSIVSQRHLAAGTVYLDRLSAELPDYFAHRAQRTMVRNVVSGEYEIRDRRNGELVRAVRPR